MAEGSLLKKGSGRDGAPDALLMEDAHVCTVEEVVAFHKTDLRKGLTSKEAEARLARFGRNELSHKEGRSVFALIAEQFQDLLVRILLAAAAVSFALALVDGGEEGLAAYVEPLVILVILVLNAAVGVWQESNAEKALEALKELQPLQARVCRDGKWRVLVSAELVPGDVVDLRCGDKVPADCRLAELASTSIRLEESQLTGESVAVLKECEPLPASLKEAELQAQRCMVFSSTSVVSGHGLAVVVKTGMHTQIGKIQAAVQEADESEDARSPLHLKLEEFGETLSKVIFAICGIVWLINIGHFSDPVHGGMVRGCIYYFKIAVALAVAAIPEGLPAVITTCLALGTRKMASKNAIVRKLQSVETLGCTTVICSDKTGTLTTNEMTASCFGVITPEGGLRKFVVEGSKFSPLGRVFGKDEATPFPGVSSQDSALHFFSACCVTCNEARLDLDQRSSSQAYTRIGEPTEAALLVLAEKLGVPDARLNAQFLNTQARSSEMPTPFCEFWRRRFRPLATLEFSRDRKRMSVLARDTTTHKNVLFVKGAPESVLEKCVRLIGSDAPLSRTKMDAVEKYVEDLQSKGLRTLALAARFDCGELADFDPSAPGAASHPAHKLLQNAQNFSKLESDLSLIGFVGVTDPPRPQVGEAISKCKKAGVRVIMITGDSVKTAEVIARAVNIHEGTEPDFPVLTGKEFEAMTEAQRRVSLSHPGGAVFARTEPKHKQMIVKLLRAMGETTAMTGDGVNDAPALKQADIGVAMGLAGTEVAKEASDMILADDNFSTIVSAVEEGRSIYNNMKAFIRYLISSNIGEVASIFLTAALGVPEGLTPVQLLWVNLVTDGPPATALGFNPADRDVMERPPRHREDSLISSWIFLRYLVIGVYVGIATVGVFVWWFVFGTDPSEAHSLVSLRQLMSWGRCSSWENFSPEPVYGMHADDPCSYFTIGKAKASTLSLTVLVVIEMFNAFNALSENQSLLRMPPWANPYLVLATVSSVLVHCSILYVPFLSQIFGVVPLTVADWLVVLAWSLPVIFIDELLKFIGRRMQSREAAESPLRKKLK